MKIHHEDYFGKESRFSSLFPLLKPSFDFQVIATLIAVAVADPGEVVSLPYADNDYQSLPAHEEYAIHKREAEAEPLGRYWYQRSAVAYPYAAGYKLAPAYEQSAIHKREAEAEPLGRYWYQRSAVAYPYAAGYKLAPAHEEYAIHKREAEAEPLGPLLVPAFRCRLPPLTQPMDTAATMLGLKSSTRHLNLNLFVFGLCFELELQRHNLNTACFYTKYFLPGR